MAINIMSASLWPAAWAGMYGPFAASKSGPHGSVYGPLVPFSQACSKRTWHQTCHGTQLLAVLHCQWCRHSGLDHSYCGSYKPPLCARFEHPAPTCVTSRNTVQVVGSTWVQVGHRPGCCHISPAGSKIIQVFVSPPVIYCLAPSLLPPDMHAHPGKPKTASDPACRCTHALSTRVSSGGQDNASQAVPLMWMNDTGACGGRSALNGGEASPIKHGLPL